MSVRPCITRLLFTTSRRSIIAKALLLFFLLQSVLWWSSRTSNTLARRRASVPPSAMPELEDNAKPEPSSIVHIVHTRFMQDQGHLQSLAQARLELFKTVCLSTLTNQKSSNFLWIIKTDPKLTLSVRLELVELLRPYPRFFLVGSLINRLGSISPTKGSWRGGEEGHELLNELQPDLIYTGNRALLQRAHEARFDVPVLETQLDSDDGLHQDFIQTVQEQAMSEFCTQNQTPSPKQWMYWCVQDCFEWHGTMGNASSTAPNIHTEGLLLLSTRQNYCVSSGMTIGYNIGVLTAPKYEHNKLYKGVAQQGGDVCHSESNETVTTSCLKLFRDPVFAVRSRTPTSAGMMNIGMPLPSNHTAFVHQDERWTVLQQHFHISKSSVTQAGQFIRYHVRDIARDNLAGQCSNGHSCKETSRLRLLKLSRQGN